jgi:hypothetical protein
VVSQLWTAFIIQPIRLVGGGGHFFCLMSWGGQHEAVVGMVARLVSPGGLQGHWRALHGAPVQAGASGTGLRNVPLGGRRMEFVVMPLTDYTTYIGKGFDTGKGCWVYKGCRASSLADVMLSDKPPGPMDCDSRPMNTTDVAIIREARQSISDPENWTQQTMARNVYGVGCSPISSEAKQRCAWGAIEAARWCHGYREDDHRPLIVEIQIISGQLFKRGLASVNDHLGHQAVLQVFDIFIAKHAPLPWEREPDFNLLRQRGPVPTVKEEEEERELCFV